MVQGNGRDALEARWIERQSFLFHALFELLPLLTAGAGLDHRPRHRVDVAGAGLAVVENDGFFTEWNSEREGASVEGSFDRGRGDDGAGTPSRDLPCRMASWRRFMSRRMKRERAVSQPVDRMHAHTHTHTHSPS